MEWNFLNDIVSAVDKWYCFSKNPLETIGAMQYNIYTPWYSLSPRSSLSWYADWLPRHILNEKMIYTDKAEVKTFN